MHAFTPMRLGRQLLVFPDPLVTPLTADSSPSPTRSTRRPASSARERLDQDQGTGTHRRLPGVERIAGRGRSWKADLCRTCPRALDCGLSAPTSTTSARS
jgi:hypothetical protein